MDDDRTELDPADIFSSSLETLYDYEPITLASAGAIYTYDQRLDFATAKDTGNVENPLKLTLVTPDTLPANWFLHASDIWASSQYLADHLDLLHLDTACGALGTGQKLNVLELGAAAGLPGILIAKTYNDVSVTVSDYPDELLIKALSHNVHINGISDSCRAVAYAWGSDTTTLLGDVVGFDIIVAADTLWNPALHDLFIKTLQVTLQKSYGARIHLVAGLHTGRYTIQSFLNAVQEAGFEVESALENEVKGSQSRPWSVFGDEDDRERRRWVVWMVLKWQDGQVTSA